MKLSQKSEWFELPTPIGEPYIKWTYSYPYNIERVEKADGEIVWFGQDTNWVKKKNDIWTYLGVDDDVKPIVFIKGENGMGDYAEYPEGRNIWIPCKEPIYETLYKQLK